MAGASVEAVVGTMITAAVVVVGHGLGGVHGLAAADAHHHVGVQSLGQTGAAEDLLLGALAAELLALDLAVAAGVQGLEALLVVGEEEHVDEEEHPAAVDLGVGFHVLQLIAALDVAAGGAPARVECCSMDMEKTSFNYVNKNRIGLVAVQQGGQLVQAVQPPPGRGQILRPRVGVVYRRAGQTRRHGGADAAAAVLHGQHRAGRGGERPGPPPDKGRGRA